MRNRLIAVTLVAAALGFLPTTAAATVIIDNTTFGFYNAGLGDLSTDSVLGVQTDIATGFNLFPLANSAAGDPVIPPVATEPNLAGADAGTQTSLGNFLSNPASLGGAWSAAPQAIPSNWTINDETAVVYAINVGPGGFSNLSVQIGVDNGVYAWFDGIYQLGAMAPGAAFANEYSFSTGPVAPGTHYLQFLREDHGGATGWILEVDAAQVGEPSMTVLLVLAAGWIGRSVRRKTRI